MWIWDMRVPMYMGHYVYGTYNNNIRTHNVSTIYWNFVFVLLPWFSSSILYPLYSSIACMWNIAGPHYGTYGTLLNVMYYMSHMGCADS